MTLQASNSLANVFDSSGRFPSRCDATKFLTFKARLFDDPCRSDNYFDTPVCSVSWCLLWYVQKINFGFRNDNNGEFRSKIVSSGSFSRCLLGPSGCVFDPDWSNALYWQFWLVRSTQQIWVWTFKFYVISLCVFILVTSPVHAYCTKVTWSGAPFPDWCKLIKICRFAEEFHPVNEFWIYRSYGLSTVMAYERKPRKDKEILFEVELHTKGKVLILLFHTPSWFSDLVDSWLSWHLHCQFPAKLVMTTDMFRSGETFKG